MNQVRLRNATDAIDALLATAELFIEAQEHADAIGALVAARRLASQDRRVPANLAANVTYTLARVLVDMCHFKSGLVCVVDHVTGGGAMAGPRPCVLMHQPSAQEVALKAIRQLLHQSCAVASWVLVLTSWMASAHR